MRAGYTLEAWKPLVGHNLFMRESGAVASQFHIPEAIEPYSSDWSAPSGRSCSARRAASTASIEMPGTGIAIAPEQRGSILAEVKSAPSPSVAWLTTRSFGKS